MGPNMAAEVKLGRGDAGFVWTDPSGDRLAVAAADNLGESHPALKAARKGVRGRMDTARRGDHGRRAGMDMGDLERGAQEPDDQRRNAQAVRQLGHHEEDRQEIDEPHHAEGIDKGEEILVGGARLAGLGGDGGFRGRGRR